MVLDIQKAKEILKSNASHITIANSLSDSEMQAANYSMEQSETLQFDKE